jgi:hypothetical protein
MKPQPPPVSVEWGSAGLQISSDRKCIRRLTLRSRLTKALACHALAHYVHAVLHHTSSTNSLPRPAPLHKASQSNPIALLDVFQ